MFSLALAAAPKRVSVDARNGRFVLPDGRTADFRGACVTESSAEQHVRGLVNISDERLAWFAGREEFDHRETVRCTREE